MAKRMSHSIAPLPIGTRILKHEICGVIGRGGFGIVYLARHPTLGVRAAVKEFCPSRLACRKEDLSLTPKPGSETLYAEILHRFDESAKALGRLSHPNIVRVQDHTAANNTSYLLMEYVEGTVLDAWMQARIADLTPETVEPIVNAILDAVSYLHAQQLLHRDISPDNILIDDTGRPVVVDFGTLKAHVLEEATRIEENGRSAVISKPFFSPPEQMSEEGQCDYGFPGDIYSIAATLYDVLVGRSEDGKRKLVSADRRLAVATVNPGALTTPPFAEVSRIDMGADFAAAIDAALSLDPLDRPQSVEEFRTQLFPQRVEGVPPPVTPRRRRGRMLLATATACAAVTAGAILLPSATRPAFDVTDSADLMPTLPTAAGPSPDLPVSDVPAAPPYVAAEAPPADAAGAVPPIATALPDPAPCVRVVSLPRDTAGALAAGAANAARATAIDELCTLGMALENVATLAASHLADAVVRVTSAGEEVLPGGVVRLTGRGAAEARTYYELGVERAGLPDSGHLWAAAIIRDGPAWLLLPLGPHRLGKNGIGWIEVEQGAARSGTIPLSRGPGTADAAVLAAYPRLFATEAEHVALIFGVLTDTPVPGLPVQPTEPSLALDRIVSVLASGKTRPIAFFARSLSFK